MSKVYIDNESVKEAIRMFEERTISKYPSREIKTLELDKFLLLDSTAEAIENILKKNWIQAIKKIDTNEYNYFAKVQIKEYLDEAIIYSNRDEDINLFDLIFPKKEEYLKPLTLRVSVPSGKIIFANDFRGDAKLFDEIDERIDEDINDLSGDFAFRRAWTEHGVLTTFLGNTCPEIFQLDNEIVIANLSDNGARSDLDGYECKGWICTDCWHFQAMDLAEYLKITGLTEQEISGKSSGITILGVEAGTYELKGYHHLLDQDQFKEEQIFARIKKVED